MTAVLLIGIAPEFVDPKDSSVPPSTTPDSVARSLETSLNDMHGRG